MPVVQRGEVGGWAEVWGEEVAALEGERVGEVVGVGVGVGGVGGARGRGGGGGGSKLENDLSASALCKKSSSVERRDAHRSDSWRTSSGHYCLCLLVC